MRVLLAEDTIANQKLLQGLLRNRGHEVAIASNGREVVNMISARPFDIVLMDVQMPIMDGLQATASIRSRERQLGRHVPIVAITAHVMPGDRERCLAAGMDAYLAKPISSDELFEAVESLSTNASDNMPLQDPQKPAPAIREPSRSSSASPTGAGRVFEIEAVRRRLGNSEEILQSLLQFFGEDYPALLERTARALRDGDLPEVCLAAHSLKGLAANFNAHDATQIAARVEHAARDGDSELIAQSIPELDRQFARLAGALAAYRATS